MDHYRTLDVTPSATPAQLRTAYLKLARVNHPDAYEGSRREVAEARMQEINEAWNVLGVAHKRKEYDAARPQTLGSTASSGPQRGNSHFRPFHDDDDLVDRSEVDLDPTPMSGSSTVPRWLTMMPIVLAVVGVVFFGLGLLVNASGVVAMAAIMVALAGVSFLMMPLIVMSRAERDPNL